MKQLTLKDSFKVSGKGLHSGLHIDAEFKPAPENTGYKFRRIDLEGEPVIDAIAENVVDTRRGTVIGNRKGDVVSTIEHAMAALYAAGIDNCIIDVNGPELPILDGSAIEFVNGIERVGVVEQNADKDFYIIKEKTQFRDEETGSTLSIYPDDGFSVECMVEYNSSVLPNQFAVLDDLADLIKGGDLDNAIVIYDEPISQERIDHICDIVNVPHMKINKIGYINPKPLAWDNEPARHKLMDLIGDLALIGRPVKGRVVAIRPGHTVNNKFTRMVRHEVKHTEIQAPVYNPNLAPIIDINGIRTAIPSC